MERFNWKENFEKILKGEIKIEYKSNLRKLILKNNIFPYKCNKCGISEWNGNEITLEIEHKDGNRFNNSKENLELLCPNCHSQTNTFRKNRSIKEKTFIKEEDILREFNNSNNINQLLINLNLHNSGGNYKRIKNVLELNNLEFEVKKPLIEIKDNKYKKDIFINKILNSSINFSKKTWGVEVAKLINKSPQWSLQFVKENLPHLIIKNNKKETQQEKKQNLINIIKESNINFNDKNWRNKLAKITNKTPWYIYCFCKDNNLIAGIA